MDKNVENIGNLKDLIWFIKGYIEGKGTDDYANDFCSSHIATLKEAIAKFKEEDHELKNGEYLDQLTDFAKKYIKEAQESIKRNKHMNELNGKEIANKAIEAVVVDFINHIAFEKGGDLGLKTGDLK